MYYLDVVSEILEDVLNESDDVRNDDLFSANQIPEISVRSYMQRLKSKSQCSNDTLIMSLIYIDKYTQADASFRLSHYSIHRYFGSLRKVVVGESADGCQDPRRLLLR